MNINNPGNTGLIDGLIRSYTGGILGGTSVTAGSGATGQGVSDQVVGDGSTTPPVAPLVTPDSSSNSGSGVTAGNNPYTPAKGDTWNAVDSGAAMAKSNNTQPVASSPTFQTSNWQQYLPQNLKSYAVGLIGNTISNLFTPSKSTQANTNAPTMDSDVDLG